MRYAYSEMAFALNSTCNSQLALLHLSFNSPVRMNSGRIANVTFVFHFSLRYSFSFVIVFSSFYFFLFCLFCICRLSVFFLFFSVFVVLLSLFLCFLWGGSANKFWLLAQLSYRWRHGQQQLKLSVFACVLWKIRILEVELVKLQPERAENN